jgi:hypothetical protein
VKEGKDNSGFSANPNMVNNKREDEMHIEMRNSGRVDPSQIFSNLQDESATAWSAFRALMWMRFLLLLRSKALMFWSLVLPVGMVVGAMFVSKGSSAVSTNTHPASLRLSALDLKYAKSPLVPPPPRVSTWPGFLVLDSVGKY